MREYRIWLNVSTSSNWPRPPVGIVRVEQEMRSSLARHLGSSFVCCVWLADGNEGKFVDADTRKESPAAGDVLLTMGLDWDYPYIAMYSWARQHGVHVASCAYDLIPILLPQSCVPEVARKFPSYLRQLLWGSAGVLCISRSTQADLARYAQQCGAPLPLTEVIELGDSLPAGGDGGDEELPAQIAALGGSPFLLYVSTIEPRKNHAVLLRALRLLAQEEGVEKLPAMVFVGMRGWGVDEVLGEIANDALFQRKVILLDHVTDAQLAKLYQAAAFCLYPSLYEGWGLPVAEALNYHKAVLASDAASIPEVGGELVRYVAPTDAQAWAQAIREWLAAPAEVEAREAKVRAGYHARDWDAAARGAMQMAERIVKGERGAAIAPMAPAALQTSDEVRHLYIDVSELLRSDAGTGIQRVVREILRAVLAAPPEGYALAPVYALETPGYAHARGFDGSNRADLVLDRNDRVAPRPGEIFLGLDLSLYASHVHSAYYRYLRDAGVWCAFVVYDMLPLAMPQYFLPGAESAYRRWLDAVLQADQWIGISHAVIKDLQTYLAPGKALAQLPYCDWFELGADFSLRAEGNSAGIETVLNAMKARPSFLMVGTIEPRKGYRQTLEAFERLWDADEAVNLVIVGKRGWRTQALCRALERNAELGQRLFWLESADDGQLVSLYRQAACLLYASEGEGYGLPLAEAAQHNLPILSRDLLVFREVAREHAVYFKGTAPDDLVQAVQHWLALKAAGKVPEVKGMPRFSWRQSAEKLMNLILSRQPGASKWQMPKDRQA